MKHILFEVSVQTYPNLHTKTEFVQELWQPSKRNLKRMDENELIKKARAKAKKVARHYGYAKLLMSYGKVDTKGNFTKDMTKPSKIIDDFGIA